MAIVINGVIKNALSPASPGGTLIDLTTESTDAGALGASVAALQAQDVVHNTQIAALQAQDTTHSGQITALQATDATHTSDIAALDAVDATHDAQIAALQAQDTTHSSDISTLQATSATHTAQIAALQPQPYSLAARPAASGFASGAQIWNTTTKQVNFSDGSVWYDSDGNRA